MNQKSQTRNFFMVFFLIFAIPFMYFLVKQNKRMQEYHDKTVEIKRADSLNLKVTNRWSNRGFHYFNDSLRIIGRVKTPADLPLYKIFERLELPFYLMKEADNDTLRVTDNKEIYFWVFRKDKDCK